MNKHNNKNTPDNGYEMKKMYNKITLGDFSASEYLFPPNKIYITRTEFIIFVGKSIPLKNNRFSWSGSCVPTYNVYNEYGQILEIIEINKDKRLNKIRERIIIFAVCTKVILVIIHTLEVVILGKITE